MNPTNQIITPPFLIAEKDGQTFKVHEVVASMDYLSNFEPVDIVNGATTVWDAKGRKIELSLHDDNTNLESINQFNFEAGEPIIKIINLHDEATAKSLLIDFIALAVKGAGFNTQEEYLKKFSYDNLLNLCAVLGIVRA